MDFNDETLKNDIKIRISIYRLICTVFTQSHRLLIVLFTQTFSMAP